MTRNKLIAFCYLFIVGIGLAMAFPVGPEALAALWSATAILGLLTVIGFVVAHRFRKPVDEELTAYGLVAGRSEASRALDPPAAHRAASSAIRATSP